MIAILATKKKILKFNKKKTLEIQLVVPNSICYEFYAL
jgi:hypothetical protein